MRFLLLFASALVIAGLAGCGRSDGETRPAAKQGESDRARVAALARRTDALKEELDALKRTPAQVGSAHREAAARLKAAGARVSRHRSEDGEPYTAVAFFLFDDAASGSREALRPERLADLRRLENLREVELNGLTERAERELDVLDGLPDLRSLVLGHCDLAPEAFRRLGDLARLEELVIGDCRLRDGDLEFLRRLPNLRSLRVQALGELTEDGLRPLESLKALREVGIGLIGEPAGDRAFGWLKGNRDLRRIEAATPSGLSRLLDHRPLLELRSFSLNDAAFTEQTMADLRLMPNLETLAIDDRGLSDAAYENLRSVPRLRSLEVRTWRGETKPTGERLRHAALLPRLERLSADMSDIRPEHLRPFRGLRRLTELSLGSAELNDGILKELADMPSLTTLFAHRIDARRTSPGTLRDLPTVRNVNLMSVGNAELSLLAELPALERVSFFTCGTLSAPVPSAEVVSLFERRGIDWTEYD
jgi:hypothetical protein